MSSEPPSGDQGGEIKTETIRVFASHEAAAVAAANLRAHGIECWIDSDDGGGMLPNLSGPGGVRLIVPASEAEAALALLCAEISTAELPGPDKQDVEIPEHSGSRKQLIGLGLVAVGILIACILFTRAAHLQQHKLRRDDNEWGSQDLSAKKYEEAERFYQEAIDAAEKEGAQDIIYANSLYGLGYALQGEGKCAEAIPIFQKAIAICKVEHDSWLMPRLLGSLAGSYQATFRYLDAIDSLKQAETIYESDPKSKPGALAWVLEGLASLHHFQKNYAESDDEYRRALKLDEQDPDAEMYIPSALGHVAEIMTRKSKYDDAEPLYRRALALSEKSLRQNDPEIAGIEYSLGRILSSEGRFSEAEGLFNQALEIEEKAANTGAKEGYILNSLGYLYLEEGRFEDAAPFLSRALAIQEKNAGTNGLAVAVPLISLGWLAEYEHRYGDAKHYLQRALQIEDEKAGDDPVMKTRIELSLGKIAAAKAEFDQAQSEYTNALAIIENSEGPMQSERAWVLKELGELSIAEENYGQAEGYYQRALQIYRQSGSATNFVVGPVLGDLAALYAIEGKYSTAAPLCEQGLSIAEKIYGPTHLFISRYLLILALIRAAQGQFHESDQLLNREMTIGRNQKPYGSSAEAGGLFAKAQECAARKDYAKAKALSQTALLSYQSELGLDDPHVLMCLTNIANLYRQQGNNVLADFYSRRVALAKASRH